MTKLFPFFLTIAIALMLPGSAAADLIYNVTVNTSSLNGTTGAVDFTFGSGLTSLPATATISGIDPLAGVGPGTITGDASGTLNPGPLTINNTPGYNDFFAQFTFTNSLLFTLNFSGPAISSPDPVNFPDGSTFAFSIFDTANNPLGNNPFGFLVTVDLNSDGSPSTDTFSPDATIEPAQPPSPVPEPNMLPVLSLVLAATVAARRRFGR